MTRLNTTKGFLQMDEATNTIVVGAGFGPSLPEGGYFIETPGGLDPNNFLGHYIVDGTFKKRPTSPKPVFVEGKGWSIVNCPAGTLIEIHDLEGKEVILSYKTTEEDDLLEFFLEDEGMYTFYVTSPIPYRPFKQTVKLG